MRLMGHAPLPPDVAPHVLINNNSSASTATTEDAVESSVMAFARPPAQEGTLPGAAFSTTTSGSMTRVNALSSSPAVDANFIAPSPLAQPGVARSANNQEYYHQAAISAFERGYQQAAEQAMMLAAGQNKDGQNINQQQNASTFVNAASSSGPSSSSPGLAIMNQQQLYCGASSTTSNYGTSAYPTSMNNKNGGASSSGESFAYAGEQINHGAGRSCSGNVTDISTPSFVVPPWKILVQHSLRLQGLVDNLDAFVHTEIGKSNLDQQSETLALLLPERWGLTAYDADLALRTRRVTGRWAPFLKNLYCPPGRLQAFQDRDRNQDLLLDKAEQVEWGCPVSADTNKDGFLDGIEWGKHCDRENEIKGSGPAKDHDVAATIPGSSIASQATPNTTATRGSRRDYDVNYDENTDSGLLDAITRFAFGLDDSFHGKLADFLPRSSDASSLTGKNLRMMIRDISVRGNNQDALRSLRWQGGFLRRHFLREYQITPHGMRIALQMWDRTRSCSWRSFLVLYATGLLPAFELLDANGNLLLDKAEIEARSGSGSPCQNLLRAEVFRSGQADALDWLEY
ncbi:unnamed protein product, partial [Amoebophrya sp. A120]|eukprot:GSA120T00011056001.1